MRICAFVALLLAACQNTPLPEPVDLDKQLEMRAVAFAKAMESRDTEAGMAYAAPSARGFFEAQMEVEKLMWGREEPREPAQVLLESKKREGSRGTVVVKMVRDEQEQMLALHFELTDNLWGAYGFSVGDSEEVRLFADQEVRLRETINRAIEESTPHAELGPLVTAYIEAAGKKDKEAMFAKMTPDCRKEQERKQSFSSSFLSGEIKIQKWRFAQHEVEGNTATQRVRTMLELADGEIDSEPMRFSFERTASGWMLTAIR